MGNKKFKLSEMIPNAWFYKLKDMSSRTRNQKHIINPQAKKNKQPPTTSTTTTSSSSLTYSSLSSTASSSSTVTSIPPETSKLPNQLNNILSHQRKSYYFTRGLNFHPQQLSIEDQKSQEIHFQESERKSSIQYQESPIKSPEQKRSIESRRRSITSISTPSSQKHINTGCSCRASTDLKSEDYPISFHDSSSDSESLLPEFVSDHDQNPQNDIVIDINDHSPNEKSQGLSVIPEVQLHPILTKKQPKTSNSVQFEDRNGKSHGKTSNSVSSVGRLSVSSPGVRIRPNSLKIGTKRIQGTGRKSGSPSISCCKSRSRVPDSVAVVKSSSDPRRDFRESMVEMILENNIRDSKDLEGLLACYLQLNSDGYHEIIIKVFKQIWFDLANVRLK